MQPLTPNERREIEQVKSKMESNKIVYLLFDQDIEKRDLWLKVLSMALAQNDTIEAEWRK